MCGLLIGQRKNPSIIFLRLLSRPRRNLWGREQHSGEALVSMSQRLSVGNNAASRHVLFGLSSAFFFF